MQVVTERIIRIYVTSDGEEPFNKWLESLHGEIRHRVKEYLSRG